MAKDQDEALDFYTQKLGFVVSIDEYLGDIRRLLIYLPNQPNLEIALVKAKNKEEENRLVGKQVLNYPFISFKVPNMAKMCEQLRAGGVILAEEPHYQKWGLSASFRDLYGNLIYAVQPPEGANKNHPSSRKFLFMHVWHIILIVKDQDEAFAFYTQKLGFITGVDDYIGDVRRLTVQLPHQLDFEIAFVKAVNKKDEEALVGKQVLTYPLICVKTDNMKEACSELKAKGIALVNEPHYQKWGLSASFRDLYGNHIYLIQPPAQ